MRARGGTFTKVPALSHPQSLLFHFAIPNTPHVIPSVAEESPPHAINTHQDNPQSLLTSRGRRFYSLTTGAGQKSQALLRYIHREPILRLVAAN